MSTNAGTTFTGTCQVGLGGEEGNACARLTSGDKHEWWVLEGPYQNPLAPWGSRFIWEMRRGIFFCPDWVCWNIQSAEVLDHMDDPKKIRQLSYLANIHMYTLKAFLLAKASSTYPKITTLQSRLPKTNGWQQKKRRFVSPIHNGDFPASHCHFSCSGSFRWWVWTPGLRQV